VTDLERRYRRLLALFPRDHRDQHGEEMLAVLIADADDRARPGRRETADLLWSAARLHLRRLVAADGGIDPREVLAIVSLLGPLALLGGAATSLHELAWWIRAGSVSGMSWREQVPDAPMWMIWFAVAVAALFGLRRTAAAGAWLGVVGFLYLATIGPAPFLWNGAGAGWVLLGAVTAVALTWSPGPARGRELVRWPAILVLAAAVAVVVGTEVLLYGDREARWLALAALVLGTVVACGHRTRVGRRGALVLLVPVMTAALAEILIYRWAGTGPLLHASDSMVALVFYGVPVLVLLALGGLPRRFDRRRHEPVG
jgi:hypothetical protein